jgi:hypothetical protein
MPRRVPDYPDCYRLWNYVSSTGSITTLFGTFILTIMLLCSNFWRNYYKDSNNFDYYLSKHNKDFFIIKKSLLLLYWSNNDVLFVTFKYNFFNHYYTIFSYNTLLDNLIRLNFFDA